MISIFKKHAPAYKRLVRRYALDVWRDKADREKFLQAAERYKRKYEKDLTDYYHRKRIKIYRGTIRAKADQWLKDQGTLASTIETIASAKKQKLTAEMFEKFRQSQSTDVQKILNKMYLTKADEKRGAQVYQVFSFADNFEAKAEQLGEQSAFELGRDINTAVVSDVGDKYEWQTQEDSRVRETHQKLNKKTFLYSDPPTTVDKYGNTHTGHPGTDWGCVTGSTPIIFDSDVKTLFRRFFVGKLVRVVTASGRVVDFTPNHPILTRRGWVAAGGLKKTDYVVQIPDKVANTLKSNVNYAIPTAAQVFNALSNSGPAFRVRGHTQQFHGDGIEKYKVDIVPVNRGLVGKRNTLVFERVGKFFLARADQMRVFESLTPRCDFASKFSRLFFTACRFVCRASKILYFVTAHFLKSVFVCLTAGTRGNSAFDQKHFDRLSADPVFFGQRENAESVLKIRDDLRSVSRKNASRVLFVTHFDYSGYVYNFETETGIYFTDLMTSHNCRCYEIPSTKPALKRYVVKEKR